MKNTTKVKLVLISIVVAIIIWLSVCSPKKGNDVQYHIPESEVNNHKTDSPAADSILIQQADTNER